LNENSVHQVSQSSVLAKKI